MEAHALHELLAALAITAMFGLIHPRIGFLCLLTSAVSIVVLL